MMFEDETIKFHAAAADDNDFEDDDDLGRQFLEDEEEEEVLISSDDDDDDTLDREERNEIFGREETEGEARPQDARTSTPPPTSSEPYTPANRESVLPESESTAAPPKKVAAKK